MRVFPIRGLILAGALAMGAAAPSLAADSLPPAGDPALRDARVAASVPNISGIWVLERGFGLRITPASGGDPPWLPWAEKVFRERAKKEVEGTPMWDPTGACYGSGVPRVLTIGYPNEIIQTPDRIVWMNESQHVFRVIYMNGKHPAKPEHTAMGHSIGHWEGQTLVVDTVGISGRFQIDERGTPQTDQMHLVERITRKGDVLENIITIDDPGAYSRPWTARRTFKYSPDQHLLEYVCEENNRNTPGADGVFVTHIR